MGDAQKLSPKTHDQFLEPLIIPRNSIKRIMKLDTDVKQVQHDATYVVGKATELFLAELAQTTYKRAKNHHRNCIDIQDISAQQTTTKFSFLKSLLPFISEELEAPNSKTDS
mmetsp:Transcript_5424/g.7056  ORF Transcript_5424/g.7056 Transcript_5424/m.7056 type:complete len:112 (+) Transcript_5424:78-413(+)